jgi:hypothetical protein
MIPLKHGVRIRHRKRATEYTILGPARLQTEHPLQDDELVVVYQGPDGSLWARPPREICDGRFELSVDKDNRD